MFIMVGLFITGVITGAIALGVGKKVKEIFDRDQELHEEIKELKAQLNDCRNEFKKNG